MTTPGQILTSLTLIERVRSHRRHQSDPEACDLFDRLYRPLVCRCCVRMGLQAADAKDVTQDVLVEVLRKLDTFEWQRPGSFRLFLNNLVRWRVLDFLSQRPSELPLPSILEIPARVVVAEEITDSAVRLGALELLFHEAAIKERDADVARLRFVAQMPAKQVGERMGMTEGAVNTAACRVKQTMRRGSPILWRREHESIRCMS